MQMYLGVWMYVRVCECIQVQVGVCACIKINADKKQPIQLCNSVMCANIYVYGVHIHNE